MGGEYCGGHLFIVLFSFNKYIIFIWHHNCKDSFYVSFVLQTSIRTSRGYEPLKFTLMLQSLGVSETGGSVGACCVLLYHCTYFILLYIAPHKYNTISTVKFL